MTFRWPMKALSKGDSNVVMEEEVEENMEMDESPNVNAPTPIPDKAVPETSEPEAEDDRQSHVSEESMDQNPPHDSDLNEDELLGPATDVSMPGGHSDDSVAPRGLSEGRRPICLIFISRPMPGLKPVGSGFV